jgi:hypothetical protein
MRIITLTLYLTEPSRELLAQLNAVKHLAKLLCLNQQQAPIYQQRVKLIQTP